jgi:hypothetical protein
VLFPQFRLYSPLLHFKKDTGEEGGFFKTQSEKPTTKHQTRERERERVRELQHTYIPASSALPKIAHVVQGYL